MSWQRPIQTIKDQAKPTAKRNITATSFFANFWLARMFSRKVFKSECKISANALNLKHIFVRTYLFDHVVLVRFSDGLIRFKLLRHPQNIQCATPARKQALASSMDTTSTEGPRHSTRRNKNIISSTNQVMPLGSMALQTPEASVRLVFTCLLKLRGTMQPAPIAKGGEEREFGELWRLSRPTMTIRGS